MYFATYGYHVVRSCALHLDPRNMSEAGFATEEAALAHAKLVHDGRNFTHVVYQLRVPKIIHTIAP